MQNFIMIAVTVLFSIFVQSCTETVTKAVFPANQVLVISNESGSFGLDWEKSTPMDKSINVDIKFEKKQIGIIDGLFNHRYFKILNVVKKSEEHFRFAVSSTNTKFQHYDIFIEANHKSVEVIYMSNSELVHWEVFSSKYNLTKKFIKNVNKLFTSK